MRVRVFIDSNGLNARTANSPEPPGAEIPENVEPICDAVWMMMQTRIVAVSYLNTIPFIYGISHADTTLHDGLFLSPPSGCAEALRNGQADLGLIPIGAIPEIPHIQIITPYCIGASGPVRTVILASHRPVHELRRIGLDVHSRTSVRLARILAAEKWHITPEWFPLDQYDFSSPTPDDTGYILIGDKVFENEARFPYLYDLAVEWRELTSLPFAFALWVAREGVDPEKIAQLEQALKMGVAHIPEAIASSRYADCSYAYDYLTRNIDFDFDPAKRRAVELYWQMGRKADPPITPG